MKKNIISIIIGVFISLAIVFIKNNYSYEFINQHYGMQGAIEKGEIDTLYIGSSLFKQGIDPYQISENSYILAYNGNQPVLIKHEIEYLLSKGIKINNLVIDMYNGVITTEPSLNDVKLLWDGDYSFKTSLLNEIKDNFSLLDYYTFFVTSNNDYLLTYPISNPIYNSFFYKGGKNYSSSGLTTDSLNQLPTDIYSIVINSKQLAAIDAIADICNKNSINLCFVEIPKYETLQKDSNYNKTMNEYSDYLSLKNITFIRSKDINFDNSNPDYFSDLIHLSTEGGITLTKELLDIFKNDIIN